MKNKTNNKKTKRCAVCDRSVFVSTMSKAIMEADPGPPPILETLLVCDKCFTQIMIIRVARNPHIYLAIGERRRPFKYLIKDGATI